MREGAVALCAWGGREGCTRLQERDSRGGSWRPLGPSTSSHAPREGKALITRTPGAQGLHRRPGKTSPSSLPGSLDSDWVKTSRRERSKEELSLTSGGGAPAASFPQGQTCQHSHGGRAPPEAARARQCFSKAPSCRPGGPEERTPRSCPHTPRAAILAGSQLGLLPRHPCAQPEPNGKQL